MRYLEITAAAVAASLFFFVPPVQAAGETNEHEFREFVRMADANKDGTVTKAEAMKAFEMMWDRHDAKKIGKMDDKAFRQFLMELMKSGA
jgi:hypothetical protein